MLECASGSSSGNFGTLKFPRTDVVTSNEIPANIAVGLQSPLTPTVHQWALDNPTLAGLCSNGVDGALTSPNGAVTLVPGTNCVDTDTGLAANAATEGLVQGGVYGPGLLKTQNTKTGCDPAGGSANRTLPITGSPSINDDVLTCYFTNGTTSIQDITSATYTGGVVFDPSDPDVTALLLRARAGRRALQRGLQHVLDRRLPARVHHGRDPDHDVDQGSTHRERRTTG